MKLKPGVWYTPSEIERFRNDPSLAGAVMKGYVLQHEPSTNRMRFVHWSRSAMDASQPGNTWGRPKTIDLEEQKREILKPIVKRTPQQRVDSLLQKVGEDLKAYLSKEAGHEVSGGTLQRVAQDSLTEADKKFEESESKRITRTTGNPYA